MTRMNRFIFITAIIGAMVAITTLGTAQELETETARLLKQGKIETSVGLEYQTSYEGIETAVPLVFEVGLLDRLELMLEPVVYTAIRPKKGPGATGIGDLEVTFTGLAVEESRIFPALAFAAEVKIPTTKNPLIGTGKFDYTWYLILSKQFGHLDTHFNLGYTLTGKPTGVNVKNVWSFATAARYLIGEKYDVFAEVVGHTSPSRGGGGDSGGGGGESGGGGGEGSNSSELSGWEVAGTVGAGWDVTPSVHLFLSLTCDNNSALLVHPGVTFKW